MDNNWKYLLMQIQYVTYILCLEAHERSHAPMSMCLCMRGTCGWEAHCFWSYSLLMLIASTERIIQFNSIQLKIIWCNVCACFFSLLKIANPEKYKRLLFISSFVFVFSILFRILSSFWVFAALKITRKKNRTRTELRKLFKLKRIKRQPDTCSLSGLEICNLNHRN